MHRFTDRLDMFCLWVARWLLPKRLLYWCFIEGGAIATTAKYGATDPTELSFMDALKRVGIETGIDKPQTVVAPPEELAIVHQQRREQGQCWQCSELMVVEMLDCPNCGAAYDGSRSHARQLLDSPSWLDPTPEMLQSPEFQAVWSAIQDWDISVPHAYMGRCKATGNHAAAILYALEPNSLTHFVPEPNKPGNP